MKQFFKALWSILPGIAVLLLLLAVISYALLSILRCCSFYEDKVITEQTREDGVYTVKLMQTSEVYREIYEAQTKGKETEEGGAK